MVEQCDVVLISMPFCWVTHPSIGLSLLKAGLTASGIESQVLYPYLELAQSLGMSLYDEVTSAAGGALVGEWVFTKALFGDDAPPPATFVKEELQAYDPSIAKRIAALRDELPSFVDGVADDVLSRNPKLVGLTSIFQQHLASLSLAARIKQRAPDVFVVMGGANCESVMGQETVRQFSFVDAVCSGEGDVVFPELVGRVLDGESVGNLPGILVRSPLPIASAPANAPRTERLDDLPIPDFDDYFQQLEAVTHHLPEAERPRPSLLFEASRGCWWGERHHCTFCGLSRDTMTFRAKSAERVMSELDVLAERHSLTSVSTVDNILPMEYFRELLPRLAQRDPLLHFFWEIKANLKREQMRLMRDAGVTVLQPGIESFSTPILKIMRKGLTALQGIQTLKWCEEFGMEPTWLVLWGFPGEPPDEYARMAELVPLLHHLRPPSRGTRIRMERFSPNYERSEELGFAHVRAHSSYRSIYPFSDAVVDRLAYYFDYGYPDGRDVDAYVGALHEAIVNWKSVYPSEQLIYDERGDTVVIHDHRAIARRRVTELVGLDGQVYLECDATRTVEALMDATGSSRHDVEASVGRLVDDRIILRDGKHVLALAIRPFERLVTHRARTKPGFQSA